MGFLHWLRPDFLFSQLNAIDEERKPAGLSPAEEAKERIRVWQIIGIACVCLLLVSLAASGVPSCEPFGAGSISKLSITAF